MKSFFRKYFLEGQKLDEDHATALEKLDEKEDASFSERLLVRHRRVIGILIPLTFFEVCWWILAARWDYFSLFPDRYLLSITMIFGATVAGTDNKDARLISINQNKSATFTGMTSEGGGAVAFPVMTLALGIAPSVARDFSLMIQSCGTDNILFITRSSN